VFVEMRGNYEEIMRIANDAAYLFVAPQQRKV